jgi:hypothetical protein
MVDLKFLFAFEGRRAGYCFYFKMFGKFFCLLPFEGRRMMGGFTLAGRYVCAGERPLTDTGLLLFTKFLPLVGMTALIKLCPCIRAACLVSLPDGLGYEVPA